ncbi:MAG TPA: diheme cytochrome c-553 [Nitrospirota bacterium]|nr:diheme cytochrome c-553 [Nitrospirota bacterium]
MRTIAIAGCVCVIMGLCSLLLVPVSSFALGQQGISIKMSMVERGHYLVTVTGCSDCHSPKKMTPKGLVPDAARLLSGHPSEEKLPEVPPNLFGPDKWGAITNNSLTGWVGPWGTSYTSNLTPDAEAGTGVRHEELFITILRTGKFMASGRDILPPMPWQDYAKLTDADMKAIFAYLKSLKPVKNQVPASVPAPPPPHQ